MKYFKTILLVFLTTACIAQKPKINADSLQIRTTVTSFYNWYLKNSAKLNSFVLYRGIKTKGQPPYKIDWKAAEKYFAYIRTSVPQLGEAFIANQRKFLLECDSAFKEEPDGEVPYGFDYDWYTSSQEDPEWTVNELKKSKQWVTTIKGNTANVDVLGFYMDNNTKVETVILCFEMKKEKTKWKIAHIGCPYDMPSPPPMEEKKDQ